MPTPMRILFVCSGNTCRSPMATVLAEELSPEVGLEHVEIRSAGTSAVRGFPASGGAQRAAGRHGLDLTRHSSTPLGPEAVEWADVIFAMSPSHLQRVRELGGGDRATLLGAFAMGEVDDESGHLAVPDPFGGDDRVYHDTFGTLRDYVKMALRRLAERGESR